MFNLASTLALAALLAGGGFVGYLYATGKLNAQRVELMAGVLRGEFDEQTAEEDDSAVVGEPEAEEVRASSADEVRALRERQHLERLEIERALADLEAQRRLMSYAMHEVVTEQESLEDEQAAFMERREQILTAAEDQGFQKELEYIESLQPRQAKEHIVRVWKRSKADAVRVFIALDPSRGRRILEQLKTPEELEIMTDLLERIRLQGMEDFKTRPGTADDGG
jgi:hypothetical protein